MILNKSPADWRGFYVVMLRMLLNDERSAHRGMERTDIRIGPDRKRGRVKKVGLFFLEYAGVKLSRSDGVMGNGVLVDEYDFVTPFDGVRCWNEREVNDGDTFRLRSRRNRTGTGSRFRCRCCDLIIFRCLCRTGPVPDHSRNDGDQDDEDK